MTTNEFKKMVATNEVAKEIKSICEKYGYLVNQYCYIDIYGEARIGIRQLDRNGRYPDVWLDTGKICEKSNPNNWTWKINASSSGTLNINEFTLFMYQLNQAKRMVEELSELDLTKLPRVPQEGFEDDDEE